MAQNDDSKADRGFIGEGAENMNRKDSRSFRFGRGRDLGFERPVHQVPP
jgi:hypothetical protein